MNLEELAVRYEREGERIARNALDRRGVDTHLAPIAASCFTIAAALRAAHKG